MGRSWRIWFWVIPMTDVTRDGVRLHFEVQGPEDGAAVVFSNSLGTTLHLWDPILPFLPEGLRIIRYDMRGHGLSDVPDAPYTMGQLVSDAEAVCDACGVQDAMFVGLSVGGMVAQGLAVKRPDLIRALVLTNTAAKIGHPQMWQDRIDAVSSAGIAAMADDVMRRWFGEAFYGSPAMEPWLDMLMNTPPQGYAVFFYDIAWTDFYTTTGGLRIPTLGIAGSEDGATPPDLVRETVDLIPGSQMAVIRRAGHLPCAETPEKYAGLLTQFMRDTGHFIT